jgi:hypothetical protein
LVCSRAVQGDPEELAVARNAADSPADQAVGRRKAVVEDLDAEDRLAGQNRVELAAEGLDLGELRHGKSFRGSPL